MLDAAALLIAASGVLVLLTMREAAPTSATAPADGGETRSIG
jgi:hypothetical protein